MIEARQFALALVEVFTLVAGEPIDSGHIAKFKGIVQRRRIVQRVGSLLLHYLPLLVAMQHYCQLLDHYWPTTVPYWPLLVHCL